MNCSYSHPDHNKIGFASFGFSYDFILILQVTGYKGKNWKNLFLLKPLARFELSQNNPWF
jgi:hypothetical protein